METDLESQNRETLREFQINDNVEFNSCGETEFGVVTGFQYNANGEVTVEVKTFVMARQFSDIRYIHPRNEVTKLKKIDARSQYPADLL